MKNIRQRMTKHKRLFGVMAGAVMLVMLFTIVFAGTLSGAFAIDEIIASNNPDVDINANVADAVGFDGAATLKTVGPNMSGATNITNTSFTFVPDHTARGKALSDTSTNYCTKASWSSTYWEIGSGDNHQYEDYAVCWWDFDLSAFWTGYETITVSMGGKMRKGGNQDEFYLAFESSSSKITTYASGNNDTAGSIWSHATGLSSKTNTSSSSDQNINLTHTLSGAYFRLYYVTRDDGGFWSNDYGSSFISNPTITVTRTAINKFDLSYNKNIGSNVTLPSGTADLSGSTGFSITSTTERVTNSVYAPTNMMFDHWDTQADDNGVDIAVNGLTSTTGFFDKVKAHWSNTSWQTNANHVKFTLYAQYADIKFTFNGQNYDAWSSSLSLVVLQNKSGYLTHNLGSEYNNTTYSYSGRDGTFYGASSIAPTAVGKYSATITVIDSASRTRGSVTINFEVVAGDFGMLAGGTGKWGSSTNPYVIETPLHLTNLALISSNEKTPLNSVAGLGAGVAADVQATGISYADCYFVLANNLDMTVDGWAEKFVPIGRMVGSTQYAFSGHFDGQNHSINIAINQTDGFAGLFGWKTSGSISNLTVTGSVKGGGQTGGLCGGSYGVTFNNITINMTSIEGADRVGGLSGRSVHATINGKISVTVTSIKGTGNNVGGLLGSAEQESASAKIAITQDLTVSCGSISGVDNVGGIIGWLKVGTNLTTGNATNITFGNGYINNANINSTGKNVGGIVGYLQFYADATNMTFGTGHTNNGNITATGNYVGGMVGFVRGEAGTNGSFALSGHTNNGKIKGNALVGGIVGQSGLASFDGCKNIGKVYTTGTATAEGAQALYAGGIVGLSRHPITNCYNSGTVAPINGSEAITKYGYTNRVGGIAGWTSQPISYCYNKGDVHGSEYLGGIVGYSSSTIDYCYVDGNVDDMWNDSGAISGAFAGTGTVSNCWILPSASFTHGSSVPMNKSYPKLDTSLTYVPAIGTTTYADWTAITAYDITGFAVSGTLSSGKYMLSKNGNGANFEPNSIYSSGFSGSSLSLTYYYDVTCMSGAITLNVSVENVTLANINTVYNNIQQGFDINNITLANIGTGGVYAKDIIYAQTDRINVGTYTANVDVKIGDYIVGGIRNSTITITKREINVTARWTDESGAGTNNGKTFVYNKNAQGVYALYLGNIIGQTGNIAYGPNDSWTTVSGVTGVITKGNASGANNNYQGTDAASYTLTLRLLDTHNYTLKYGTTTGATSIDFTWTIHPRTLTVLSFWDGADVGTDLDTFGPYTYTGTYQGLKNAYIKNLVNDNGAPYDTTAWADKGIPGVIGWEVSWGNLSDPTINAGTYTAVLFLRDTTNYKLHRCTKTSDHCVFDYRGACTLIHSHCFNNESDGRIEFSYTINKATLDMSNFYYQGEVSNNDLSTFGDGKYTLNAGEGAWATKPALVYQGDSYNFANFHFVGVNNEILTLVNNNTTAQAGLGFYATVDGALLADFNTIKIGENDDPRKIVLTFAINDTNYQFAENGNVCVFTVMNSDFGVLKGKVRNDGTWGSESNPYVISRAEHLIRLSQIVNGSVADSWDSITTDTKPGAGIANWNSYQYTYFIVTNDITVTSSMGFNAIGSNAIFAGTFFGATANGATFEENINRTISLTIDKYDYNNGLFARVDMGAHIHHLTIDGSVIGGENVGLLAGQVSYQFPENNFDVVKINDVIVKGSVSGELYVGAIVGNVHNANVNDVIVSNASITGADYIGGAVGRVENGTVHNVTITGLSIDASGNYVGGIAGYVIDSNIVNSSATIANNGSLRGKDYVGGAIGYSTATVTTNEGASDMISSTNLINLTAAKSGNTFIQGANYVGGLIGYADNTYIEELDENDAPLMSYVGIPIRATGNYVGGIVGYWIVNDPHQINGGKDLTYNANNFEVEGGAFVGSLVGNLDASTAMDFTLTPAMPIRVSVKGNSFVGGLYGAFTGHGYKATSTTVNNGDTRLIIDSSKVTIGSVISSGAGNVFGGVVGYIAHAGLIIGTSEAQTSNDIALTSLVTTFSPSKDTNYVGGLVGVVGNNATIEGFQNIPNSTYNFFSITNNREISAGHYTGGIVGYMSSTAGTYYANDWTVIGNNISLINNATITGKNNVGGIVGAIGKLDDEISGSSVADDLLKAIIQEDTGNIVTFGNKNNSGIGESSIYNTASISGSNTVGGIVGGVYTNAQINFVNNPVASADVNTLKVYSRSLDTNSNITISGDSNVGGIVGHLGARSHNLQNVLTSAIVGKSGANKVGGIVGEMYGGTISHSLAYGPVSTGGVYDAYLGASNVGGVVGNLIEGNVIGTLSIGMKFDGFAATNASVGAVAGAMGQNASVTGSWGIMYASGSGSASAGYNPNYTTKAANNNGKHIIIDSNIAKSMSMIEMGISVGIFNDIDYAKGDSSYEDVSIGENGEDESVPVKAGYLSIAVSVPNGTNFEDSQLAFYDASGQDKASGNTFDGMINQNNVLYFRVGMDEQKTFSICLKGVEFKDIKTYSGGTYGEGGNLGDTDEGRANAALGYVKPGNGSLYGAQVTKATYDNSLSYNIKDISANITYDGHVIGHYEYTFETGDAGSPYVIASQTDWENFVAKVRGRTSFSGQYVKLMTDDVKITSASYLAGTDGYPFSGTFDGNGHTITINLSNAGNGASVFPYASGATFRNLTIAGSIEGTINTSGNKDTGGSSDIAAFVGKARGSTYFYNCINEAYIHGFRTVAGIIAYSDHHITLEACANVGDIQCEEGRYDGVSITADKQQYQYGTGGITAYAKRDIKIESCYNRGNISGGHNVGGIIGYCNPSSGNALLEIYNCANTGDILAHSGSYIDTNLDSYYEGKFRNPSYFEGPPDADTADASLIWQNVFSNAGGLVGRTGQYSRLQMSASYNTGTVTAYGMIVGGLIGSCGEFQSNASAKNLILDSGRSYITYCYNTGNVNSAGTHAKRSLNYQVDLGDTAEEMGGGVAGGITGGVGDGTISYCYNTGNISSYGFIGYGGSWHNRIGGIVGQAQPMTSADLITVSYCYNLGKLKCDVLNRWVGFLGVGDDTEVRYGAPIVGYTDNYTAGGLSESQIYTDHVKESHCYTLGNRCEFILRKPKEPISNENYTGDYQGYAGYNTMQPGDDEIFLDDNWFNNNSFAGIGKPDKNWVKTGTTISLEDLTSVFNSDATMKPASGAFAASNSSSKSTLDDSIDSSGNYTNEFKQGTLAGYTYVYGCLPQLTVFTLDTRNALSMLSVGFGQDQYGRYNTTSVRAGSMQHPYIIIDGIDLLGLSALSDLKEDFDNQYIEFANALNNIHAIESVSIDMPTGTGNYYTNKNAYTANGNKGKSYHLFEMGGLCASSTSYENLKSSNYAYYASSTTSTAYTWTKGVDFFNPNFYPIGFRGNQFKGNISGEQADGTNTNIRNLLIVVGNYEKNWVYAGLFGETVGATIDHITVTGEYTAYTSTASGYEKVNAYAGGIVASAMAGTVISNCGNEGVVKAIGNTGYTSSRSGGGTDYFGTGAGGIVGYVRPGIKYAEKEKAEVVIENCFVNINAGSTNYPAAISAMDWHIGGIVGYVYDDCGAGTLTIKGCDVHRAIIQAISSANGYGVGGIIGTSNANCILNIDDVTVGNGTGDDDAVHVKGAYALGGIVGGVRANTRITNAIVGQNVTVERLANANYKNNYNDNAGGTNGYSVATGGIVGHVKASIIGTTALTLSDYIAFKGHIKVATESSIDKTRFVGGIIGNMSDTRFIYNADTGNYPTVVSTGSITISGSGDRANIGGVAGYTVGASFIGSYAVAPTFSLDKDNVGGVADNVGGFIGANGGDTAILAYQQGVDDIYIGEQKLMTMIVIGGNIAGRWNVGGFVGYNMPGNNLYIAPDTYNGINYGANNVSITILGDLGDLGENQTQDIYLGDKVIDRDVELKSATISASGEKVEDNNSNAGGLIGWNEGNVTITKGIVNIKAGATIQGTNNTGGIIGWNNGELTTGGSTVQGSTLAINNGGSVTGKDNTGGIIGQLSQGTIDGNFTNSGSIQGVNNVGGVIGHFILGTVSGEHTNSGSVSGANWVGGVIGRMSEDARIDATEGKKAVFQNISSNATTSGDALVAEDTTTQGGNVTATGNYVGGSIGAMIGTIEGDENGNALFINEGSAQGANYIGGSIGVLNGTIRYVAFINRSGDMQINASSNTVTVGGSVGFVGNTLTSGGQNRVVITNSHFENDGSLTISNATPDTSNTKGVGGVIGAIEGFKEVGGVISGATSDNWRDNTFYVSGTVSAPNLNNVGGVVGIIMPSATNLEIKNMLSYLSSVRGNDNVGGIVGATLAQGTKITNSFNVEGSVEGGLNVGGIIGLAYSDASGTLITDESAGATDASTSYWMKGENNSNLEKLGVESLHIQNVSSLKYAMYKLAGTNNSYELLTSAMLAPADFVDEQMTQDDKDNETNLVITSGNNEASVATSAKIMLIRHGETTEDTVYNLALRRVFTIRDIIDEANGTAETVSFITYEYQFYDGESPSDNAWTAFNAVDDEQNNIMAATWKTLLDDVITNIKDDTGYYYTQATNTASYTTGKAQTGWFFKYAGDAESKGIGNIVPIHNKDNNIEYWKHIAGAVTYDLSKLETTGEHGVDRTAQSSGSYLTGDGNIGKGIVYVTAEMGRAIINTSGVATSGYYLYMATSTTAQPAISGSVQTAVDDFTMNTTSGNFSYSIKAGDYYVNVPADGFVGNIAIFYKPLNVKASIKYNGYNRVTPISNPEIGIDPTTNKPKTAGYSYTYKYNGGADKARDAQTYTDNISVTYTYNEVGYPMNVAYAAQWRIAQKDITLTTKSSNKTYGDTNNHADITIDGIAQNDLSYVVPNDNPNALRSDNFTLKVTINGARSYYVSLASHDCQETGIGYYVKALQGDDTAWHAVQEGGTLIDGYTFTTAGNMAVSQVSKGLDKTFTENNLASSASAYKMNFRIQFKNVATYNLKYEIVNQPNDSADPIKGTNYRLTTKDAAVNVKAAKLTITIDDSVMGNVYDGKGHSTTWSITGWKNDETHTTIFGDKSYKDLFDVSVVKDGSHHADIADSAWKTTGSGTNKRTTITPATTFVDVGKYSLYFEGLGSVSAGQYKIGNYYFEVVTSGYTNGKLNSGKQSYPYTIGQVGINVVWSPDNGSKIYDGTTSSITATVTAYDTSSSNTSTPLTQELIDVINECFTTTYDNGTWTSKGDMDFEFVNATSSTVSYVTGANAGTYKLTMNWDSSKNTNVVFVDNTISVSYKINRRPITVKITSAGSTFTYNTTSQGVPSFTVDNLIGDDTISLDVSFTGSAWNDTVTVSSIKNNTSKKPSVTVSDAGTYTMTIAKDTSLGTNYTWDSVVSTSWTINKAKLTISVDNTQGAIYDGENHVPEITASVGGTALGQPPVYKNKDNISLTYSVKDSNGKAVDNDDVINAGTYTITLNQLTVKRGSVDTGDNGVKLIDNYAYTSSEKECNYTITPANVSINDITGFNPSKVYDGTTSISGYNTATVKWTNTSETGVLPKSSRVTGAVYDTASVGTGKKVTYTVSLNDDNFEFTGSSSFEKNNGTITPRELVVTLDKLRGSKATRAYDGTLMYGGAGVTLNGTGAKLTSAVYKTGEGFSVSNYIGVRGDDIQIKAYYQEIGDGREDYHGFVNNAYKDETTGEFFIGGGENTTWHKKLVFEMSGAGASNYTFVVKVGGNAVSASSATTVNVYDKDATGADGYINSGIDIEITVKVIKATYTNTAQSYATADNDYNTTWSKVVGTAPTDTGLTIAVVNGWRYDDGIDKDENPTIGGKQYTKYTVIRGSTTSKLLGASIEKDENGLYINYRLTNQPTLTIGYFINSTEFEIGSLASLIIASYYWELGTADGSDEFNKPVVSGFQWVTLVSKEGYDETFEVPAGAPAAPEGCTTWAQYFDYIESSLDVVVFYNDATGENGWGYYKPIETDGSTEDIKPTIYTSFKQVANISGVLTDKDITILNNFFAKYYDENGAQLPQPIFEEWGVGKTYVNNFINVGAGNVMIAMDSIFKNNETQSTYDGNGYTINHFNIIGSGKNVGMFANATDDIVKNVHLRNFNIIANGSNVENVGGIIGFSGTTLENSTFHGSIQVNGTGQVDVGGLIGDGGSVDGAIVLGSIDVNNANATTGGVIGAGSGSVTNVVSMIGINSVGTSDNTKPIGGTVGNNVHYLANSVWYRSSGTLTAVAGGVSYSNLYAGSKSGYAAISDVNGGFAAYVYPEGSDTRAGCGTYDMIDSFVSTHIQSSASPRESMRLCDLIDVYLLMYSLNENGTGYMISSTSWLVGNKKGTDSSKIVIANQQGVALLRELRFASFELACDVEMYSSHEHNAFDGAFYGSVDRTSGNFIIKLIGANDMFEKVVCDTTWYQKATA